jgi:16S rRNA (guanine527-N7)-methyltransferase
MDIILKYFSDFSGLQISQFEQLEGLYKEWNEKINVISRKDIDGLYEKHVLHSLSIAAAFELQNGAEIVDLGTGGGFPGIPLAVFFPDVKFHLVDSIAKKLKVAEAIAESIGLKNITTQHSRIEDIKNRKFDFVVSRAVAPLKDLWKWSKPLLRNKAQGTSLSTEALAKVGHKEQNENNINASPAPGLICLKGGDLASEIQESGARPRMLEVYELFREAYFKDKYLLYIPK